MAYVPGGLTFPWGEFDDSKYTVKNAYWIAETETTYELWKKVYDWATDDARETNKYTFANPGQMGSAEDEVDMTDQHPVTMVSWRDCIVWCNALTEWYNANNGTSYDCVYYTDESYTTPLRTATNGSATGNKTPGSEDYPYIKADADGNLKMDDCSAKGFRLLTKHEWELAARYRGNDTTNVVTGIVSYFNFDNMEIKWTKGNSASGDTQAFNAETPTVGDYAVYIENSSGKTAEVKTKIPNALDLYDMSGNVGEWVINFNGGFAQLYRGGSYNYGANYVRVGLQSLDQYVNNMRNYIGFRFARSQ